MQLTIHRPQQKKVHPKQIISYRAFRERFHVHKETESRFLNKFYATRLLIEDGFRNVFVDATLIPRVQHLQKDVCGGFTVDVCGERNRRLTAVFCETKPTTELHNKLRLMGLAKNTEALIMCSNTSNINYLITSFDKYFNSGKFSIKQINWLSGGVNGAFKEMIALVSLLGNHTRMRMLLPLLTHSRKKRQYRQQINPKLIYENLATLMENKLINEKSDDEYSLTPIGCQILSEYLTFIQNLKRIIENTSKEVNKNSLG